MRKVIHITGKVQGVYFRKYTQWKAEELGITGFVRNEPNGSVYIEAQGDEEVIDVFEKWCHVGSPLAHVEALQSHHIPEITGEEGFELIK
jgi:acylphosphatase